MFGRIVVDEMLQPSDRYINRIIRLNLRYRVRGEVMHQESFPSLVAAAVIVCPVGRQIRQSSTYKWSIQCTRSVSFSEQSFLQGNISEKKLGSCVLMVHEAGNDCQFDTEAS